MSQATVFWIHLVLGYVAWLLFFSAYAWPKLKTMDWVESQRAIATLHSFYAIPIIYVPALMITHIVAFYLLVRPQAKAASVLAGNGAAC